MQNDNSLSQWGEGAKSDQMIHEQQLLWHVKLGIPFIFIILISIISKFFLLISLI